MEGTPYILFLIGNQAAGFAVTIWRGSAVGRAPSLPSGLQMSPDTLNLGSNGKSLLHIGELVQTTASGSRALLYPPRATATSVRSAWSKTPASRS